MIDLTARQRAVALGISLGQTNQEMARNLGVGLRTIENETQRLRELVGALDKTTTILAILQHNSKFGVVAVAEMRAALSEEAEAKNCPCCGRLIEPSANTCDAETEGA